MLNSGEMKDTKLHFRKTKDAIERVSSSFCEVLYPLEGIVIRSPCKMGTLMVWSEWQHRPPHGKEFSMSCVLCGLEVCYRLWPLADRFVESILWHEDKYTSYLSVTCVSVSQIRAVLMQNDENQRWDRLSFNVLRASSPLLESST